MYNKTIIRFGFCDIGKCYQHRPSASADNPYFNLDYSGKYNKSLRTLDLLNDVLYIKIRVFRSQNAEKTLSIFRLRSYFERFFNVRGI